MKSESGNSNNNKMDSQITSFFGKAKNPNHKHVSNHPLIINESSLPLPKLQRKMLLIFFFKPKNFFILILSMVLFHREMEINKICKHLWYSLPCRLRKYEMEFTGDWERESGQCPHTDQWNILSSTRLCPRWHPLNSFIVQFFSKELRN